MSRPILLSALLVGLVASLPVLYLWWAWPTVPELVPTHFGANGLPDHFTSRQWLWNVAWWPALAFAVLTFLPQVHAGQSIFWSSYQQRQLRGLVVGGGTLFVLLLLYFSIRDGKNVWRPSAPSVPYPARATGKLARCGLFGYLGSRNLASSEAATQQLRTGRPANLAAVQLVVVPIPSERRGTPQLSGPRRDRGYAQPAC